MFTYLAWLANGSRPQFQSIFYLIWPRQSLRALNPSVIPQTYKSFWKTGGEMHKKILPIKKSRVFSESGMFGCLVDRWASGLCKYFFGLPAPPRLVWLGRCLHIGWQMLPTAQDISMNISIERPLSAHWIISCHWSILKWSLQHSLSMMELDVCLDNGPTSHYIASLSFGIFAFNEKKRDTV